MYSLLGRQYGPKTSSGYAVFYQFQINVLLLYVTGALIAI